MELWKLTKIHFTVNFQGKLDDFAFCLHHFKLFFRRAQLSRVTIFFEDFLVEEKMNFLGYKLQHFISDCGGLLGLFMGCSLLSIVEIIYHVFSSMFSASDDKPNDEDQPEKRSATLESIHATNEPDDEFQHCNGPV